MMSPEHERLRLIAEAAVQATALLGRPVDTVCVRRDMVVVRAGLQRLRGRYGYSDSLGPDGKPILGGGHWWVSFDDSGRRPGWLGRLLGQPAR